MSDKPSEYLKRTCLICGCHTNQTINIYEPRSGPNIVQLIQAKFKFQPLNEDKYLCFSCNNWLINWHSLQALNSNDADSPSGTFRPHMNSMLHEESGERPSQQRKQQQNKQITLQHKVMAHCRPVAQVRPWQLTAQAADADKALITSGTDSPTTIAQTPMSTAITASTWETSAATRNLADTKPIDIIVNRHRSSRRPSPMLKCNTPMMPTRWHRASVCCMCGKRLAMQLRQRCRRVARRPLATKCRRCHLICNYLRSIEQRKCRTAHKTQPKIVQRQYHQHDPIELSQTNAKCDRAETVRQSLQRPLIDGKLVAMLRRLGTTLSRENTCENGSSTAPATAAAAAPTIASQKPLPLIMSPAKSKPRWTRRLDEDEILLDFDAAISEVLPLLPSQKILVHSGSKQQQRAQRGPESKQVKRKLVYQMTNGKENRESACPALPEGLSISMV